MTIMFPNFQSRALHSHSNEKLINAFQATGLETMFKAEVKPESDDPVELYIYDIIGTAETNAATFQAALEKANGKPLTIHLSSPGGSVFEGMSMYNQLKSYKGPTTVTVDGVCASIASIFALGADTVETAETSMWMIHNAWVDGSGNATGLRAEADILDKIDEKMMQIYASKAGDKPQHWAEIMAAETWFTSEEAFSAGLIDNISASAKPSSVNASAKPIEVTAQLLTSVSAIEDKDLEQIEEPIIEQPTEEQRALRKRLIEARRKVRVAVLSANI